MKLNPSHPLRIAGKKRESLLRGLIFLSVEQTIFSNARPEQLLGLPEATLRCGNVRTASAFAAGSATIYLPRVQREQEHHG
jgi:hypothetical protein